LSIVNYYIPDSRRANELLSSTQLPSGVLSPLNNGNMHRTGELGDEARGNVVAKGRDKGARRGGHNEKTRRETRARDVPGQDAGGAEREGTRAILRDGHGTH
jgi:hypothetical protein